MIGADTEHRTERGRARLAQWQERGRANFYLADEAFREVLPLYLGSQLFESRDARFKEFGAAVATIINEAAKETNKAESLPQLRRYDNIGRRTEGVHFHPDYHSIGKLVYATRVMSDYATAGQEAAQLVIQYLLCQNGEAGHACPLACTAGLIKMLQRVAAESVRERFLPALLDPNYDSNHQASQFLTELQGGSDVGANTVEARPVGDGRYRIHGEKWFCSVANADVFLMTARPTDAPEGTAGLGAFIVPRMVDTPEGDRVVNEFTIRRLKDKLGTRSMASAEIDFQGALAWPLGPVDQGFKNVIEIVLTTSRIYNAVSSAGIMRRVEFEAFAFAEAREAFGRSIRQFPLVQRSLAKIKTETQATVASSFTLAEMSDRLLKGQLNPTETQAFRALVGMNKLATSLKCSELVHEGMELMGGNGAIEEFSVLPRLYRDSYVLEAWEGTHNVLSAQLARDFRRYQLHEGLFAWLEGWLNNELKALESASLKALSEALGGFKQRLQEMMEGRLDRLAASIEIRDFAEELMALVQAFCLARELLFVSAESQAEKRDVFVHFLNTRVLGLNQRTDPEYCARIGRLAGLAAD